MTTICATELNQLTPRQEAEEIVIRLGAMPGRTFNETVTFYEHIISDYRVVQMRDALNPEEEK